MVMLRDMASGTTNQALRPFAGTVNVTFYSTVLASTERAMLGEWDGRPAYFIPIEDIHFALMRDADRPPQGPGRAWDVTAVGESAPGVLLTFDQPPEGREELARHGVFVSDAVEVRAEPVPDQRHSTEFGS
jgi:uncharacterized protein (DUF427 family)